VRATQAVSVIGFDDIWAATYHNPSLTTIRQPLRRMGALAAETLLERIENRDNEEFVRTIEVAPEIVVRESTAPPPATTR
jgi:LacI family transcriptional regulator